MFKKNKSHDGTAWRKTYDGDAWPEGDDEIVKIIMEHFFDSVFLIPFLTIQYYFYDTFLLFLYLFGAEPILLFLF